jgi:hypothetical protein
MHITFPQQQWLRERAGMLRYTMHVLSSWWPRRLGYCISRVCPAELPGWCKTQVIQVKHHGDTGRYLDRCRTYLRPIERPALIGEPSYTLPWVHARNKSQRNIIILVPEHCYGNAVSHAQRGWNFGMRVTQIAKPARQKILRNTLVFLRWSVSYSSNPVTWDKLTPRQWSVP